MPSSARRIIAPTATSGSTANSRSAIRALRRSSPPAWLADPRAEDHSKPALRALPTFPADTVDGVLVKDAYLFLECRLKQIVDDLGDNSLIIGDIVAARLDEQYLRAADQDDQELIHAAPLLAYLYPGRFTQIDQSFSFPFPKGFKR